MARHQGPQAEADEAGNADTMADGGFGAGIGALAHGTGLIADIGKQAMKPSPQPPSTLMVKARMPRLKTKAARQWSVTVRRIPVEVIDTSEVWKVMPRVKPK